MATRKATKSHKRPRKGNMTVDTPIVVGGGGGTLVKQPKYIRIKFDHNHYTPNPGDIKEHHNPGDELRSLWINDVRKNIGQSTKLKIECDHPSLGSGEIRIKVKPLGVRFEPGRFLYNSATQEHRGDDWIILKVTADKIANPLYEYDPQQGTSNCVIEVNRRQRIKKKPVTYKRIGSATPSGTRMRKPAKKR